MANEEHLLRSSEGSRTSYLCPSTSYLSCKDMTILVKKGMARGETKKDEEVTKCLVSRMGPIQVAAGRFDPILHDGTTLVSEAMEREWADPCGVVRALCVLTALGSVPDRVKQKPPGIAQDRPLRSLEGLYGVLRIPCTARGCSEGGHPGATARRLPLWFSTPRTNLLGRNT